MNTAGTEDELSIRSRHGLLRDLVPIYSLYQLLPNLAVAGILLWLGNRLGHFPTAGYVVAMLGWVFQFMSRPSVMRVSTEQAAWLEALLEAQGLYARQPDGRWRAAEKQWWRRWPHEFIEFAAGDAVTLIAPRDAMASFRDTLELVGAQSDRPFALDQPLEVVAPEAAPELPWHARVPTALLGGACAVAWIWLQVTSGVDGIDRWGLSAGALAQGRFETICLHMFAHGSAMHLVMNLTALSAIGATLTSRLGRAPLSWMRFLMLFGFSGLAGAALYLAVNPAGTVPMVGASGGLYGLIGLMIRTPSDGGAVLKVDSGRVRRVGWDLVKENVFLFALLALISWSSGNAGGLAWEAHLGGFLFGLCLGPRLLPRTAAERSGEPRADTLVRVD
jgi:membrane associated rhomboid family serine protease